MKLLFVLSLFCHASAFEVLNCVLDPCNVNTWDLTEVENCEIPEDQFKNGTNIKVQIVKNLEKKFVTVYNCKLYQTDSKCALFLMDVIR